MNTIEVGQRLVELASNEQDAQAVDELYADNILSIEAGAGEEMPTRWEGIGAVREKHAWWNANATMHETKVEGPYAGAGDDQFVAKFWMDVTMNGERSQMSEVGVFQVTKGKITRESYLPLID